MAILIGCSPSTGSSLLRRIMNRHSQIFCGAETSMFAKEGLYLDWEANKHKLTRPSIFGLSNTGWHNFVGVELDAEYQCTPLQLKKLIKAHSDFPSFVEAFYQPSLKSADKKYWAEKTPSNAFTLQLFLNIFPQGKTIHIVRHPLDAIASLMNRGMTAYNAVAVYLLNTAKALEVNDDRCHLVKYEALVVEAEKTSEELCRFLGLKFEATMLESSGKEKGVSKMEGWNYDETNKIQQGSVGRFSLFDQETRAEVLNRIAFTQTCMNVNHKDIRSISDTLGYALPTYEADSEIITLLEQEKEADLSKRYFSRYYFRRSNYPLIFGDELV